MTKNKLADLNDHLFMQLERLGDESVVGEDLEVEIQRAKAISSVAEKVIDNGKLMIDVAKFMDDRPRADQARGLPGITS